LRVTAVALRDREGDAVFSVDLAPAGRERGRAKDG
jgi:hypothetical protein